MARYFLPSRQYLLPFNSITNIPQSNAYSMDFLAINCARRTFRLIADQKPEIGYSDLLNDFICDFRLMFETVN